MGGDGDLRSGHVRGRETGAQRGTGVMEGWRDEGGAETAKRRQVGALQMLLVLALSLPCGEARGPPKASPYIFLDYFFYFFVLGDVYRRL